MKTSKNKSSLFPLRGFFVLVTIILISCSSSSPQKWVHAPDSQFGQASAIISEDFIMLSLSLPALDDHNNLVEKPTDTEYFIEKKIEHPADKEYSLYILKNEKTGWHVLPCRQHNDTLWFDIRSVIHGTQKYADVEHALSNDTYSTVTNAENALPEIKTIHEKGPGGLMRLAKYGVPFAKE